MDKSALRREFTQKRCSMSSREFRSKNDMISSNAKRLINWPALKRIHIYRSQLKFKEVDTTWIEAYIYTMWPDIAITVGNASPTATIPSGQYDLIIVPIVAFDERLNRLGFGGGWYDRFLQQQPDAQSIGLAYELQAATQITAESHDIPLDYVVTERRILSRD